MNIMYGKIRVYASANTQITITSGLGNTRTVTVPSEQASIDITLAGMEEYTLSANNHTEIVLLNINDFVEVTL